MPSVTQDERTYLIQKAKELVSAKHSEKNSTIQDVMKMMSCSYSSAYRFLTVEGGYKSERKRRHDAGDITLSREHCLLLAGLITVSPRSEIKAMLALTDALKILVADGKVPDVSAGTDWRAMSY